jgi:threonine/homoserine/homoserine lactone efflux protein
MTIESWIIYLTLVTAATATPGPAVLLIITNSTLYGWKKSIYAALGNIIGLFFLGIIAITGLGTLLDNSLIFFNLVKYAGAAYLVYLGLKLIFQKHSEFSAVNENIIVTDISSKKIFFRALTVAISNPKAIAFLTALFPQFIHIEEPLIPQFSLLITTLMAFSFFFLMSYALLAQRIKNWLNKSDRVKYFNRASGSIFIGFGLLLASSSNR